MNHGGNLGEALNAFGGERADWLDLSTGINPDPYPFDPLTDASWSQLPQADALDALLKAARRAYGAPVDAPIVAAPGTQMLIQLLPVVRPAKRVAVVGRTYGEHAVCWQRRGSAVARISDPCHAQDAEIVILGNPNNPDGRRWSAESVLACAEAMARRGGLLIVDEAFADVAPEVSVAAQIGTAGLVVLRSFGKFFGLAGIRLGFALGPAGPARELTELLGPWAVSGPAIDIGIRALNDLDWQQMARIGLARLAARLDRLLAEAGLEILGGTALFRLASHPDATALHRGLAEQAIWVRRFDDQPQWLRFGLPGSDAAFARLAAALRSSGLAAPG